MLLICTTKNKKLYLIMVLVATTCYAKMQETKTQVNTYFGVKMVCLVNVAV
jgi:hypothetical protein